MHTRVDMPTAPMHSATSACSELGPDSHGSSSPMCEQASERSGTASAYRIAARSLWRSRTLKQRSPSMPADDALARFSVDLHQELLSDAAAQPDGALTADVYTQRMIEHLTEAGELDDGE